MLVLLISQFMMGAVGGFIVSIYAMIKSHGDCGFTTGVQLIEHYSSLFAVIYNALNACFTAGLFIVSALLFGKKIEV